MGWFNRRQQRAGGYEDKAALSGFGGYEPSDSGGFAPTHGFAPEPKPEPEPEPEPRSEPKPNHAKTRRAVLVGFAVILVWGGMYYVSTTGGSDDERPRPTTRPPSTYTPPPQVKVPAVVAGWQSVASRDGTFAYDVPARWTPKPGTIHGWEGDGRPTLSLTTSAFYRDGYCEGERSSRLAGAGVRSVPVVDAAEATAQTVTEVAERAYTWDGPPPRVSVGEATDTEISLNGKKVAVKMRLAEVTPAGGHRCLVTSALVGAIALSNPKADKPGSAVLVVYADQTRDQPTTRDEIAQMLRSFRGVPEKDRSTIPGTPSVIR
ncbi:hypothetical protein [Amycolatopsis suaedae]|uniref:DUF8017 domain-containing protein n=1 Tax=Amycolatopsis suaedae TaxID=2510978 RepID=A0A4Q7JCK6_9PSEU|nr:hypothetical protein [Amycolatopsis suaedae]RZQ64858.1 hypothetical protein EWH70_08235 [Amycolatopsis suaedae]